MGTPLYGTLFGTMAAGNGAHNTPASAAGIWAGCYAWIAIYGAAAVWLYVVTLAIFDRCMGRMPESDGVAAVHIRIIRLSRAPRLRSGLGSPFAAPDPPRI